MITSIIFVSSKEPGDEIMVSLKQQILVCLQLGHLVVIYLFQAKCSHFAVSAKAEDFCS